MKKSRKDKKITVIIIIIIILLILFFTSKETIEIMGIQSNSSDAEASETAVEENANYYYVESSDGVQVPVPVGYTASEIEGETGVSTGFVIYEGDIDWSEIIVDETDASSASLDISNESVDEEIATTSLDDTCLETSEEESNSTSSDISEDDEGNSNVVETSSSDIENSTQDTDSVEETNTIDTSNETSEKETFDSETSNSENEIESDFISDDETDNIENEIISESEDVTVANDTEETDEITNSLDDDGVITTSESDLAVVDTEDYYLSDYYSEETASNIWDLQCTTNQYVWIPVSEDDLETIYRVDSNGKYWGITYSNYSTVYQQSGEPAIDLITGYDIDSKLTSYLNGSTRYEYLAEELETNFAKTIESIRKYGGFYIGRYETGNLSSVVVVEKNNSSSSGQTWYVKYEKCKTLSGENDYITTSMIWGSLWDYMLRWLYDEQATTSDGTTLTEDMIWSDSTNWGNYYDATFDYYTAYNSTSTKSSSVSKYIATGCSEYTKVNNIYDLAGNSAELTLECFSSKYRIARGGRYNTSYNGPVGTRINVYTTQSFEGCRAILYIN